MSHFNDINRWWNLSANSSKRRGTEISRRKTSWLNILNNQIKFRIHFPTPWNGKTCEHVKMATFRRWNKSRNYEYYKRRINRKLAKIIWMKNSTDKRLKINSCRPITFSPHYRINNNSKAKHEAASKSSTAQQSTWQTRHFRQYNNQENK